MSGRLDKVVYPLQWKLAIYILWAAIVFVCHVADATFSPRYALSRDRVTWSGYMTSGGSDDTNGRCVVAGEREVKQWLEVGGSLPPGLAEGLSVWLPAVAVRSLTWTQPAGIKALPYFSPMKGCYLIEDMQRLGSRSYPSTGPFSCFQHCQQRNGSQIIVLQGHRCYCVDSARLTMDSEQSHDNCSVPCLESPYTCGRPPYHYSVYDNMSDAKLLNVSQWTSGQCFTAKLGSEDLSFQQQSCSDITDMCMNKVLKPTTEHEISHPRYEYQTGSCTSRNIETGHTFFERITKALSTLGKKLFRVNLAFETHPVWLEERGGYLSETGGHGGEGKCVALVSNKTGRFLEYLPCGTRLHYYLPSPCDGTHNDGITEEEIELATAVGLTGIICFVLFVVLAITLYVLKRSGRLRVRRKPAFNSTGDWDQPEESAGVRGLKKESLLSELQARLSPTRGSISTSAGTESRAVFKPASGEEEKDLNCTIAPLNQVVSRPISFHHYEDVENGGNVKNPSTQSAINQQNQPIFPSAGIAEPQEIQDSKMMSYELEELDGEDDQIPGASSGSHSPFPAGSENSLEENVLGSKDDPKGVTKVSHDLTQSSLTLPQNESLAANNLPEQGTQTSCPLSNGSLNTDTGSGDALFPDAHSAASGIDAGRAEPAKEEPCLDAGVEEENVSGTCIGRPMLQDTSPYEDACGISSSNGVVILFTKTGKQLD